MLEEIVRHDADVICLQEVDHFRFFLKSLAPLGYHGHFFPKPDSPCLYLPDNTGPDGCAIFYKTKKFDLTKVHNRVIEVWHVESNQVSNHPFVSKPDTNHYSAITIVDNLQRRKEKEEKRQDRRSFKFKWHSANSILVSTNSNLVDPRTEWKIDGKR